MNEKANNIHEDDPRIFGTRSTIVGNSTPETTRGELKLHHSGGHLLFEADIIPFIPSGSNSSKVRVVVAVNNTLTPTTLLPGQLHIYSPTYCELETPFEYFNYAGIDHSVVLYSTSTSYIQDIAIDTQSIDFDAQHVATSAVLNYTVIVGGTNEVNALHVLVQLLDANGIVVANSTDSQHVLLLTDHISGNLVACTKESYLYTLKVTLYNDASPMDIVDVYRIPHVGIRTIRLTDSKFLVNERPFYFHEADVHEDSDICGKGFDQVILTKHFNLYGWVHGNAFRTSHYPFAEEYYSMADRYDIAIIDQTPATSLNEPIYYSQGILEHSKQVIVEMIARDRNHPSILVWCLGNEPASDLPEAELYFSSLVNFTRPMTAGRPLTLVLNVEYNTDRCIQHFDIVCINRYFGWYTQEGRLDQVPETLYNDLINWRRRFPTKPLMISEYGAETLPGLHNDPSLMFTEEYQNDLLSAYHVVFDNISSIITRYWFRRG